MSTSGSVRLVQRIVRLALDTFYDLSRSQTGPSAAVNGSGAGEVFKERFRQLTQLLSQLTDSDVGFDKRWLSDTRHISERHPSPPMTYIRLLENDVVSVGIFILYKGFSMPMHDHPHMYGLLKVLGGRVRVQPYSRVDTADGRVWDTRHTKLGRIYRTAREPALELSAQDATCVLTPHRANIHQVSVVGDGPAAFLDILAPPYDEQRRVFHCFKELPAAAVNDLTDGEVQDGCWLMRVIDRSFLSDSRLYVGPPLDAIVAEFEAKSGARPQ